MARSGRPDRRIAAARGRAIQRVHHSRNCGIHVVLRSTAQAHAGGIRSMQPPRAIGPQRMCCCAPITQRAAVLTRSAVSIFSGRMRSRRTRLSAHSRRRDSRRFRTRATGIRCPSISNRPLAARIKLDEPSSAATTTIASAHPTRSASSSSTSERSKTFSDRCFRGSGTGVRHAITRETQRFPQELWCWRDATSGQHDRVADLLCVGRRRRHEDDVLGREWSVRRGADYELVGRPVVFSLRVRVRFRIRIRFRVCVRSAWRATSAIALQHLVVVESEREHEYDGAVREPYQRRSTTIRTRVDAPDGSDTLIVKASWLRLLSAIYVKPPFAVSPTVPNLGAFATENVSGSPSGSTALIFPEVWPCRSTRTHGPHAAGAVVDRRNPDHYRSDIRPLVARARTEREAILAVGIALRADTGTGRCSRRGAPSPSCRWT